MGSLDSPFQFLSYKIDNLNFKVVPTINALSHDGVIQDQNMDLSIMIRDPNRKKEEGLYIGGLDVRFKIYRGQDRDPSSLILQGNIGIAGLFKVIGQDELTEEMENNLVLLQIPVILMPYLRASLTSVFSSAGIGTMVFPLINVRQLAIDMKDKIKIVDMEDKHKNKKETN